jgi:hypothetical protein
MGRAPRSPGNCRRTSSTPSRPMTIFWSGLHHHNVDGVCTNPPYGVQGKLACQFITHALALVPVVAMLLRVDFDSGKTRVHLFRDCKAFAHKIVLMDRIVWFEHEDAAGPSDNHAWFLWDKQHEGAPTISYAQKQQLCPTILKPTCGKS